MRTVHAALARRARLAGLAAGALVVGAGAAFAAPPSQSAALQSAPVQSAPVQSAPVQPAPQEPAQCPEGLRNHGEHVSSVARSVKAGPEHGQLVSAAARGICGKGLTRVKLPKASRDEPDEKAPKVQKAERPVRGHEREGHRGRGPARP